MSMINTLQIWDQNFRALKEVDELLADSPKKKSQACFERALHLLGTIANTSRFSDLAEIDIVLLQQHGRRFSPCGLNYYYREMIDQNELKVLLQNLDLTCLKDTCRALRKQIILSALNQFSLLSPQQINSIYRIINEHTADFDLADFFEIKEKNNRVESHSTLTKLIDAKIKERILSIDWEQQFENYLIQQNKRSSDFDFSKGITSDFNSAVHDFFQPYGFEADEFAQIYVKLLSSPNFSETSPLFLGLEYILGDRYGNNHETIFANQYDPQTVSNVYRRMYQYNMVHIWERVLENWPSNIGDMIRELTRKIPFNRDPDSTMEAWHQVINETLPFLKTKKGCSVNCLKEMIQKTLKKWDNIQFKLDRLAWLMNAMATKSIRSAMFVEKDLVPVFEEMFKLHNSEIEKAVTEPFLALYNDSSARASWMETIQLNQTEKLPQRVLISALLLFLLNSDCKSTRAILKQLSGHRFRDRKELAAINEFIHLLTTTTASLSDDKKLHLLNLIIEEPTAQRANERSRDYQQRIAAHRKAQDKARENISILLAWEYVNCINLENITTIEQANEFIPGLIVDLFKIDKSELQLFDKHFTDSKRFANGLLIYASRLQSLTGETGKLNASLQIFVRSILDNKFATTRYNLENNPHLKMISEKDPARLEAWKSPIQIQVGKIDDSCSEGGLQQQIKKDLLMAIENKHLGPDSILSAQLLKSKDPIDPEKYPVESLCLELLSKEMDIDEMKEKLKELQKKVPKEMPQFQNDVADLLKKIASKRAASTKELVVKDTDEWEDLFLLGTEVLSSCQHIALAQPLLNKCLLAYVLDGKNRAIVVKNSDGKIVARSVLRLLWDTKAQKPVLLMEPTYTDISSSTEAIQMVKEGCLQKAKAMKLPLVVVGAKAPLYPNTVEALGGPVPYEYCDSVKNICPDGKFQIPSCEVLYDPEAKS